MEHLKSTPVNFIFLHQKHGEDVKGYHSPWQQHHQWPNHVLPLGCSRQCDQRVPRCYAGGGSWPQYLQDIRVGRGAVCGKAKSTCRPQAIAQLQLCRCYVAPDGGKSAGHSCHQWGSGYLESWETVKKQTGPTVYWAQTHSQQGVLPPHWGSHAAEWLAGRIHEVFWSAQEGVCQHILRWKKTTVRELVWVTSVTIE